MSEPVYSRAPDVVWRLGPDRVLVRRIGAFEGGARDLQGSAALVWISLDDPANPAAVRERIQRAGVAIELSDALDALRLMVDERLIVR